MDSLSPGLSGNGDDKNHGWGVLLSSFLPTVNQNQLLSLTVSLRAIFSCLLTRFLPWRPLSSRELSPLCARSVHRFPTFANLLEASALLATPQRKLSFSSSPLSLFSTPPRSLSNVIFPISMFFFNLLADWLFSFSVFLSFCFFQIRANYIGENGNCKLFAVPSAGFGKCNSTATSGLGVTASSGIHSLPSSDPVVSADWLHANLKEPDVKVIQLSLIILQQLFVFMFVCLSPYQKKISIAIYFCCFSSIFLMKL